MDKSSFMLLVECYAGPITGHPRSTVNKDQRILWLQRMCVVVDKERNQQLADMDYFMAAQTQEHLNKLLNSLGQLCLGVVKPAPRPAPPVRRPPPPVAVNPADGVDDGGQFIEDELV